MKTDAAKNPRTNFGNRSQTTENPTRPWGPGPARRLSQNTTETTDSTRAQIPIQMSRPITFIRVKAWIGASPWSLASSATTANPAASAYSEVPTQAPASPGDRCHHALASSPDGGIIALVTKARMKIITTAQIETTAIPIEMCSLSALTAPPIAMDPETPHTAPPVPSTAPKRGSRPNSRVAAR